MYESLTPDFKTIEEFQLGALLGKGGEGSVFRALHRVTGTAYAVKEIARSDSSLAVRRARRSLSISARIASTACVVRTIAILEGPNRVHVVMPLIDNSIVMDITQGNIAARLLLLSRAARALAALHNAGIVHRDVKPSNFLVDALGQVVVCDLGLAKLANDDIDILDTDVTGPVPAGGTPPYIAPEQLVNPSGVGTPADIFSLGVLLYKIVVGRLPIAVSGNFWYEECLRWHRDLERERISLHSARGAPVVRSLEDLCGRALEFNPASRPSAMRFSEELTEIVAHASLRKRTTSSAVLLFGREKQALEPDEPSNGKPHSVSRFDALAQLADEKITDWFKDVGEWVSEYRLLLGCLTIFIVCVLGLSALMAAYGWYVLFVLMAIVVVGLLLA